MAATECCELFLLFQHFATTNRNCNTKTHKTLQWISEQWWENISVFRYKCFGEKDMLHPVANRVVVGFCCWYKWTFKETSKSQNVGWLVHLGTYTINFVNNTTMLFYLRISRTLKQHTGCTFSFNFSPNFNEFRSTFVINNRFRFRINLQEKSSQCICCRTTGANAYSTSSSYSSITHIETFALQNTKNFHS